VKIVWRPLAVNDRAAIFGYIAQANPAAALALDEQFDQQVNRAAQNPKLYKPGRVVGTREIVVRPNYILVYRADPETDTLTVVRVLHAAQQWP